jgi:GTPase SAR1 family protein
VPYSVSSLLKVSFIAKLRVSGKALIWNEIKLQYKIRRAFPMMEAQSKEAKTEIKVVLFGDGKVGKSSLMQRFCDDTFQFSCTPTLGT